MVEVCIESLQERFQTLEKVQLRFGVIVNFLDLPIDEVKKQCEILSKTMNSGGQSD